MSLASGLIAERAARSIETVRSRRGAERTRGPRCQAMAGEGVNLVVRQASGGEMTWLRGDRIRGDATLFVREDCVEAAWSVVDPILGNATPVHEYEPNTGVQSRLTDHCR